MNRRDDLKTDEIFSLSKELGRIDTLYLTGGEPFIRQELSEICRYFIQNNRVEQIYVPTNAYFTDKIASSISDVLEEPKLKLIAVEISLDGMPKFHNKFRGSNDSFQKAMKTYDALVVIQKNDSRLRIHAVSTITEDNINEVHELTGFLHERCPKMDHHNIALIRGDWKNPSLKFPNLTEYQELYRYVDRLWADREKGRFGSSVEPMLQWAKVRTAKEQKQVVPCRAGVLSAVVYANGDVSFCEMLPALGNLRNASFMEMWQSEEAKKLRNNIRNKECFCTNEIFLWPSIVFQPLQLAKAMFHIQAWKGRKE